MSMTVPASGAVARTLRSVCGLDLDGATSVSGPPLEESQWRELVATMKAERLEGLLAAAVAKGVLTTTAEQTNAVREMARARARLDLMLERECLWVAEVLKSASVAYRMIKGPALAHLVYPDPSLRGFGDVDVLVDPSRWDDAVFAIEAAGSKRLVAEIRQGFDARFGKDATFASPRNCQIDLHRGLVFGPYGFWVDADELFARAARTITLGGRELPVLGPEETFVYACYSAALGDDPPRIAALRDVAEIIFRTTLDVEVVTSLVCRWRGVAVIQRALQLVRRYLAVDLGESVVGQSFGRESIATWDRVLMATYRGPGRGYTSQLAGVVAIRGTASKMRYLVSLAFPQRSYLNSRGFTPVGFVGHAARRVRGRI